MRTPRKLDHDPRAVAKAREDARLSQYRLAKRLQRSRSLISEIEGGTRNATPELLEQMAEIFGVDVSKLKAKDSTGTPDTSPAGAASIGA